MTPLWVVAIVCLLHSNHCRDLAVEDPVHNAAECLMVAEEMAAQWIERHPEYEFLTARCSSEPPAPDGDDI